MNKKVIFVLILLIATIQLTEGYNNLKIEETNKIIETLNDNKNYSKESLNVVHPTIPTRKPLSLEQFQTTTTRKK